MSDHQNVSAEEDVLGAMMMSESAIITVSPILSPDSFYRETNGLIYKSILELWHDGKGVDATTLAHYMGTQGTLDKVGGSPKLATYLGGVVATSNVQHYAEIVRDHHILRELSKAGLRIQKLADEGVGDAEEIRSQAQQALAAVADAANAEQSVIASDFLDEIIDDMREAYRTGVRRTGLLTGYTGLDDLLLGFWPGQFIICAARPAQGKSTLALNIAENVVDSGLAAAFFSYEMSKGELIQKSLGRASRIDTRSLASGQMSKEEAAKLPAGIKAVKARSKLFIHDDPSMSLAALISEATRLRVKEKIDVVVIDYIQLIPSTHAENRQVEVSIISRALKVLAKKLDIPVLALCQMSRAIEGSGRRPVLSDLRESGSLEQDADVVMFLYDESEYDPDKQADGTTEVIVKKNRKGPNDTVKLAFNKRWSRFHTLPKGK